MDLYKTPPCRPNTVPDLRIYRFVVPTSGSKHKSINKEEKELKSRLTNLVLLLLKNSANANIPFIGINECSKEVKYYPLHMAIQIYFNTHPNDRKDFSEVVSLILEKDPNLNVKNEDGETPLYLAIRLATDPPITAIMLHQMRLIHCTQNLILSLFNKGLSKSIDTLYPAISEKNYGHLVKTFGNFLSLAPELAIEMISKNQDLQKHLVELANKNNNYNLLDLCRNDQVKKLLKEKGAKNSKYAKYDLASYTLFTCAYQAGIATLVPFIVTIISYFLYIPSKTFLKVLAVTGAIFFIFIVASICCCACKESIKSQQQEKEMLLPDPNPNLKISSTPETMNGIKNKECS